MNITEIYASIHQYDSLYISKGILSLNYTTARETEPLYTMGEIVRVPIREDITIEITFDNRIYLDWGEVSRYKKLILHCQGVTIAAEDIINIKGYSHKTHNTIIIRPLKIQVTTY